jgi:hypothetical protein
LNDVALGFGRANGLIVQNQISAFLIRHAQALHPVDAQMLIHHGKQIADVAITSSINAL